MISPWLQSCIYSKISLLFETSFTAIHFHFFSGTVIIHGNILSNPICQGHCFYFKAPIAAIHYIKRTGFTSRTVFIWGKQLQPYFLKLSVFTAELVAVIFTGWVLCYAAILSWWMCLFDQSSHSLLSLYNEILLLQVSK